MARIPVGGTATVDQLGKVATPGASAVLYLTRLGGTPIADVIDEAGAAIPGGIITIPTDGIFPLVRPEVGALTSVWVSVNGGPRQWLPAHNSVAGAGGGAVDSGQSTLSERAAPPTRKAVAAGTLRIVVMGDSKIEGVGASDREHSWQRKLLATLRATYGSADTGYGYWPAISGHPFVVPNPALAGATATALPNAYGLGMKAVRLGINDTLTYPAQQATKITVFYSRTMFFGGTADVLIDGAVVGSINSAGAEESGRTVSYTVSAGAHTVQIKGTSGSASAVVEGVLFETASSGVKLFDGAHGGYRADLFAQGGADIGSYDADDRHYEAVAAANPHLVIIGLGANDMAGVSGGFGVPVNATAFGSYLSTIVTRLRAAAPGCAIVFVMATRRLEDTANPEILTDHEEAARKAIGSLPGVTILYESSLWLPNATSPQDELGWLADSVHPSDLGHAEIARHVADRLGEDPRLTNARTPTGAAGGGLTGTYPNPTVAAVRGVTVSATAPTAGQVLTASSGTAAGWTTPAAGAGDATTTAKGVVQLAGDLAGTAAAPTVAKVNGTTTAATGLALLGAASAAAAKTTLALTKADVGLSSVDNPADTAKVFAGAQITSGTVAYARLPVGTAVNTVAAGDDSRFTNSRTPTAHASAHAAGGSDALTLTAAQLSDLTETVQDIVGALIVGGTNVTVTYNDAAGTFTVNAAAGGGTTDPEIVRDVIGGALLAGAGVQITVNDAADTITIASTAVLPTRQVATGTGLTGGGDLSVDRTLAVDFVADGAPSASKAVRADDSRLSDARTPVAHTHPAAQVSDSTAVGRSVLTAADAATARAAIGAGTSDLGAHKATHAAGGSDAVTLTNLAAGGTSPVRRLRAASNGSLSWVEPLFARKAADQQYLNTAALADVTDLGIDLEADSVYVGSAQITYFTGATSVKCSLGWTLPAGATMSWAANGISSAATTVAAAISRANLTGAQSQSVGSAGASAIDAHPTFIIMTGATAGRLQLQAAQGTADAVNALTIKANSWLRAERVV